MSRRKRYSAEFKREALKRANEEGVTDVLVAEEPQTNTKMSTILENIDFIIFPLTVYFECFGFVIVPLQA